MDNLPSTPLDHSSRSTRESKIKDNIAQNKIIPSADFNIRKGVHGTTLELKSKHKFGYAGVEYAGEYDPSAFYREDEVVRVLNGTTYSDYHGTTVSASVGTWVCTCTVPDQRLSDSLIAAGHTSGTYAPYVRTGSVQYFPITPEPATSASVSNPNGAYWQLLANTVTTLNVFQLATGPGVNLSDYVIAYPWNGTTYDTAHPTNIAKPYRLRASVGSETVGGVTYTYTYSTDYVSRTVTWTYNTVGYSENQTIVPPWVNSQLICAINIGHTGVTGISGADIGWQDMNINAQAWMRQFS